MVPPHILNSIIESGNPKQRERASKTLECSCRIRRKRCQPPGKAPHPPHDKLYRIVYDWRKGTDPGSEVRTEDQPPTVDPAVEEAFHGTGAAYDLFHDEYGRISIDDRGSDVVSVVHWLDNPYQSQWDAERIFFGDGDEDEPEGDRLFNRFTKAVECIGHEFAHGVVWCSARLAGEGEPGALNEHFADVFGSLVKQRHLHQTADEADWLFGMGILAGNPMGGIRSLKAPGTAYGDPLLGKDPQPDHMKGYLDYVDFDDGGVHVNSGIPNRAFYEAARRIGGYAWEKAGLIWYDTLAKKLQPMSTFQDAADATYQTAGERYGIEMPEQKAVAEAWKVVGIRVS